ncbi:hypothetical protein FRX31_008879 [Thalictrum thalictroides]|uniref:Uncharacterized protein n=1 Tax=Thalictrum thalictroides TaxID=46969 RepID=A0A7J6WYA0_THATH|nr:hypothetical protein FRX31_008879 [Thalictrum thalictroides]
MQFAVFYSIGGSRVEFGEKLKFTNQEAVLSLSALHLLLYWPLFYYTAQGEEKEPRNGSC